MCFGSPALSSVSGDLLTNSKQTTPWQNCTGSNLIDNEGDAFDPGILGAEGCVYRETPAIAGEQYTLTCAVTSFEYSSMTLAFHNDNGESLDTLTTEIIGESSGTAHTVTLAAPSGATVAAVGVYGHPGSGFQGCTLLLDNIDASPVDGSVAGLTWFDENGDAVREGVESVISSTPVALYLNDQQIDQTVTDKNGAYYFGGPDLDQCYRVHFQSPDPTLELTAAGGDNDVVADGSSADVCLDATAPNVTGIDAGFVAVTPPAPPEDYAVCGTTWLSDAGGLAGQPNVSVVLVNTGNGEKVDTHSGDSGGYAFANLPAGDYQLYFIGIEGYTFLTQGTPLTEDGSYTGEDGASPVFNLPGDSNGGAGDACTLIDANAILEKTPVALDPTIANDDEVSGLIGEALTVNFLDNDVPCDAAVGKVDLIGHNVPGNVSLNADNTGFIIADTTATGTFSIDYGLRGACGSYDTAVVIVKLDEPPPPPPPAAPPAPGICQASVGKRTGTEPGVHVDLILSEGETADVFEPTYNFYDADMKLVFTGQLADAGVRDWGIFFRKREHGIEVFDVAFVTAVRDGVESNPTECVRKNVTPLALDTDGSGRVERIAGEFRFDIDADGLVDSLSGWFAPTDGILVLKDHGANISGEHLFGDTGGMFADGFEKLATLDLNSDGAVSGNELNQLAIWTDRNSNALVDDGELSSIESHDIVSLPVSHYGYAARATRTDGTTMILRDLWFPMQAIEQAAR